MNIELALLGLLAYIAFVLTFSLGILIMRLNAIDNHLQDMFRIEPKDDHS